MTATYRFVEIGFRIYSPLKFMHVGRTNEEQYHYTIQLYAGIPFPFSRQELLICSLRLIDKITETRNGLISTNHWSFYSCFFLLLLDHSWTHGTRTERTSCNRRFLSHDYLLPVSLSRERLLQLNKSGIVVFSV